MAEKMGKKAKEDIADRAIKKENNSGEILQEENVEIEVVDEAMAKVLAAENLAENYKLMAQRTQADFDNFRKRNNLATKKSREDGEADVLLDLMPVLDNLERAISIITDEKFRDGIQLIIRQFEEVIANHNVKEIDALGKPFDPTYHNAVAQVECDGIEEGLVAEVFLKGYTYRDYVLRHSMVKVSK